MKLKARNGNIFSLYHWFQNDNYIEFSADVLDWGIGLRFAIGDSRRFFDLDFLIFHLTVWF